MKKKKPGEKLNNISPEYDSVREQAVLLEDMHKDIKTIAEQHSSIVEKLNEHSESLDVIKSDIVVIKSDIVVIKSEIVVIKSDIVVIKSELGTVKVATMENSHRIKALEAGQQELKAGQQRIEQKLDTVTTGHGQRIAKLEERVLP